MTTRFPFVVLIFCASQFGGDATADTVILGKTRTELGRMFSEEKQAKDDNVTPSSFSVCTAPPCVKCIIYNSKAGGMKLIVGFADNGRACEVIMPDPDYVTQQRVVTFLSSQGIRGSLSSDRWDQLFPRVSFGRTFNTGRHRLIPVVGPSGGGVHVYTRGPEIIETATVTLRLVVWSRRNPDAYVCWSEGSDTYHKKTERQGYRMMDAFTFWTRVLHALINEANDSVPVSDDGTGWTWSEKSYDHPISRQLKNMQFVSHSALMPSDHQIARRLESQNVAVNYHNVLWLAARPSGDASITNVVMKPHSSPVAQRLQMALAAAIVSSGAPMELLEEGFRKLCSANRADIVEFLIHLARSVSTRNSERACWVLATLRSEDPQVQQLIPDDVKKRVTSVLQVWDKDGDQSLSPSETQTARTCLAHSQ